MLLLSTLSHNSNSSPTISQTVSSNVTSNKSTSDSPLPNFSGDWFGPNRSGMTATLHIDQTGNSVTGELKTSGKPHGTNVATIDFKSNIDTNGQINFTFKNDGWSNEGTGTIDMGKGT